MDKISAKELRNFERKLEFYHFEELSSKSQQQLIVRFKEEINPITYSDLQFENNMEVYKEKEEILLNFLKRLLEKIDESHCIIRKYNDIWIVNNEIVPQLNKILSEQNVSNKDKGALYTGKKDLLVEFFIQSVFRYNSFVQLIFKEKGIVISPSDHMDIFIDSSNFINLENEILQVIENCGQDKLILVRLENR